MQGLSVELDLASRLPEIGGSDLYKRSLFAYIEWVAQFAKQEVTGGKQDVVRSRLALD